LNDLTDRLTGTILDDKYLIEHRLGSGGMCDVYRARHIAMDKEIAIKILKPELAADSKIAQRFEQEARAASRVRHPHAIDVTDYGIGAHNVPYLVMQLVDGQTVRELIGERGPLSIERVTNILRQASGALEAAHSVGVIHRDIKPDNIIIAQVDGEDWVEVVDFGVAKIQEDVNRRASLTGANFIIGTPRYMSPEQCEEKPVDARSDIYSLGVVAYEMLTGDAPFDGTSSTRLLMAHVAEPPPPLRHKRPDISPQVEAVVMRALEKNPDLRQQSAAEFAREFEMAAGIFDDSRATTASSRISVPLDEIEKAFEPLRQPDDENTLVRSRVTSAAYETDRNEYRSMARGEEADLLPSEPDPHDPQSPSQPYLIRTQRPGRYRNSVRLFGLLVLMIALGFVAYAIFGNRSRPADSNANQAAESKPASDSQTERAANNASSANRTVPTNTTPAPGEPTEETTKVDTGKIQQQVQAIILNAWGALQSHDLNGHMSYYAPRLRTFYLKTDVDRATVRSEITSALSSYDSMRFRFRNIEVRVDPSGKSAIATYDKAWDFSGRQPWSGTVQERLWLVKNGDRWQINGIRDLKVYRQ
jgi:serine/threonine protein kinase